MFLSKLKVSLLALFNIFMFLLRAAQKYHRCTILRINKSAAISSFGGLIRAVVVVVVVAAAAVEVIYAQRFIIQTGVLLRVCKMQSGKLLLLCLFFSYSLLR